MKYDNSFLLVALFLFQYYIQSAIRNFGFWTFLVMFFFAVLSTFYVMRMRHKLEIEKMQQEYKLRQLELTSKYTQIE